MSELVRLDNAAEEVVRIFKISGAVVTRTSLKLPPDLAYAEWEEVGKGLKLLAHSVQWWVGDWLAHGENYYGDDMFQALTQKDKTLANWASVCRRVPDSRRREDLDFSHHAEVTKLSPSGQEKVLERAAYEGASVLRVREMVGEEVKDELENEGYVMPEARMVPCPHCGGTGEVEKEA